jgi:hypothetical protein
MEEPLGETGRKERRLMKNEKLRKVRWIAFGLAAFGILQTPIVIMNAISHAAADHGLIVPFVLAFAIRVLFIGFFLKIWWDTRADANASSTSPKPTGIAARR